MSRLRRPAGRLRDLPIWSKLGLIMLVPTLATILVGTLGLVDHIRQASNAERARTLSVLSQASGGLVEQLQFERTYAVLVASTVQNRNSPQYQQAMATYHAQWAKVDAAKLPYAQQRAALNDVPDKVNLLLSRLDLNLEDLPAGRTQAAKATNIDQIKDIVSPYNQIINDLLNVRDASAQLASDTTLSDHMRAAAAVSRAKEFIAEQRDVGHEVRGTGDFNASLRRKFLLTDTGYQISEANFRAVANDVEQQLFDRTLHGDNERAATNLTIQLVNLQGQNTRAIPFTHEQWQTAMVGYNALFRKVETNLDAGIVNQATKLRNDTNQRVFLETSVLIGMLLLAIMFAWLVARSMARSLRELRQGAWPSRSSACRTRSTGCAIRPCTVR